MPNIRKSPKQVQVWLGHKSINITMDTYTNLFEKITKEQIFETYKNLFLY